MGTKKALIIVESPTKIKTLKKFLPKETLFASSLGHVRDLPEKGFGINVENDFEPDYQILPGKKEVIAELKKLAKQADVVYLSPDPDREGEAIAWHITSILPQQTVIKRAAFNAITKEAVEEAIAHPNEINLTLVNAQQARRLLDRIVGYKLSPVLARKVQGRVGISAGRVQSVALKLVVDREKEIEAFIPIEYWNIGALLTTERSAKPFHARLYSVRGKRWEKEPLPQKEIYLINNEEKARQLVEQLKRASYIASKVEKKEKRRHPEPPFITSTLQQEASRHYRFSASKTMTVAQSLYEGVDMKTEGVEGLITYMRTDSVRVSPEALQKARGYIKKKYGLNFLPDTPRHFKSKKTAQDAHEAIRPTNFDHPPEKVQPFLTKDQFALYSLIWKRFIASQMMHAVYDTVSADIDTDQEIVLRTTGSILKFQGFLAVYEEKEDEEPEMNPNEHSLPDINEGDSLSLIEVQSEQAFTKPPPRFSEASLVKELEKSGIGRPSTYAAIMNKIQRREYTVKENQRLIPTELGRVIAAFLETHFTQIMDVGFTASMEDTLELVAEGKKEWKSVIREFWDKFIPTVETAEKEAFVPKIETDLPCPKCSAPLLKIWSKSRYFYGCSKYPECDYTASIEQQSFNREDYNPDFDWDQSCPLCENPTTLRHGRYGPFLGCTRYPECKGIVNVPRKGEEIVPQADTPPCPAIDCDGKIVSRRSRFGKTFYSCSNFPDCDVIVNELDQLKTKYPDHPKTAYVKKKRGGQKGNKGGSYSPSKELKAVIGEGTFTRGEATKKLWEYIKTNKLQNPEDKREIIPDEKLATVFGGSEPVNMFKLAGLIGKHLKK
ncbi:MAG: type I DNA topoisomerase [Chlamydiia bacterium]|nr:type I DNA topoisomerase [Chlamydiia bacterium]